jgi:hypothetical protein
MAQIGLEVEWGETPFGYAGGDSPAWPAPLIRPCRYPEGADPAFFGKPITVPDALLERYLVVEKEFLALQTELHEIAEQNGELG